MRGAIPWRVLVAGTCLSLAGTAVADADAKAGRIKFDTCTGCHSIPGYTNVYPTYHVPKLGAQHAAYIVAALNAYKAGDRPHETMRANAASLSPQDMADIAAYVAAIPEGEGRPSPVGNAAAGEKKAAACAACHGADGNSPDPAFPRLAGQHADYLLKALQDYQSGARRNAIMNGIAAPLSAQDQADLSAYFASQPRGLAVVE